MSRQRAARVAVVSDVVDTAELVGFPNLDAWRTVVTRPPTFAEVLADAETRQFSD